MINQSAGHTPPGRDNGSDIELEIRSRYAAARTCVPEDSPLSVLHIGAAQTAVAFGRGAQPDTVMVLAIGSQLTSSQYFRHTPPSAAELEHAIMVVEDEVTRARSLSAAGSTLVSFDSTVLDIALNSGADYSLNWKLSLEAVESTFNRFALVTLGGSASIQGIPEDETFTATLLILREFMHHLQFDSVNITTS